MTREGRAPRAPIGTGIGSRPPRRWTMPVLVVLVSRRRGDLPRRRRGHGHRPPGRGERAPDHCRGSGSGLGAKLRKLEVPLPVPAGRCSQRWHSSLSATRQGETRVPGLPARWGASSGDPCRVPVATGWPHGRCTLPSTRGGPPTDAGDRRARDGESGAENRCAAGHRAFRGAADRPPSARRAGGRGRAFRRRGGHLPAGRSGRRSVRPHRVARPRSGSSTLRIGPCSSGRCGPASCSGRRRSCIGARGAPRSRPRPT